MLIVIFPNCSQVVVSRACCMCDYSIIFKIIISLINDKFLVRWECFQNPTMGPNSLCISQSQVQFRLHGPSLRSKYFNNVQLFTNEDVDVTGSQMLQNIEASKNINMRRKAKNTTTKQNDLDKKIKISQKYQNKKEYQWRQNLMKSACEEKIPIKWQDYVIKILSHLRWNGKKFKYQS